jgi:GNAT superfamily N-acetyltransferase
VKAPPLLLVLPERWLRSLPRMRIPPDYELRVCREGEEGSYERLLRETWVGPWEEERFASTLERALPGGIFMMVHRPTGSPVATAAALHSPRAEDAYFPYGGMLANLAVMDPHKRRGLTYACILAVLGRFQQAGYHHIRVEVTEDREASARRFLMMGFVPYLTSPATEARWKDFLGKLGWPYSPDEWPRGPAFSQGPGSPRR